MAINPSDIFSLLHDQMNPAIRRKTLNLISTLNSESSISLLANGDFKILTRLLDRFEKSEDKEEIESILQLLINSTAPGSPVFSKLINEEKFIRNLWANYFCREGDDREKLANRKLAPMLLSNLTINEEGCQKILKHVSDSGMIATVRTICGIILKKWETRYDSASKIDGDVDDKGERENLQFKLYSTYILRNFTQSADVRRILVTESSETSGSTPASVILARFLPILTRTNEILKVSVADIVRNICFDTDLHQELISIGTDDLLSALLYPLLGGEQLSDDENDALPIDLQYADSEKEREPNSNIRIKLLEALYQLCATSPVREYIRKKGAYYVLREYHKWEQKNLTDGENEAAQAELLCGNLIGVVIRTEDEIGCDNLRTLEASRAADDKAGGHFLS